MLLTCSFAYGNIWLNVIWDAFVCVLNAKNIFHKKKIKTVLITSISILLKTQTITQFPAVSLPLDQK